MTLKIFLLSALTVLVGCQAQEGQECSVTQRGIVRLQKGTSYAGVVELCWKTDFQTEHRWLPLCDLNNGWTESEAEAVCKALGISTDYSGPKALLTHDPQTFMGWRMRCNRAENCTVQTTNVQQCFFGRFATVICDLPTLSNQPTPECASSATTLKPTEAEKVQTPESVSHSNCSEYPSITTSSLGGVGQIGNQTGCVVLIGVLGSSTAVATLLLVGMIIGCLWSRRHYKAMHFLDSSNDEKVATPTDRHKNLENPTYYNTDYATIHDQAQEVAQATPPPVRYQPAMYDTIEDPVITRNTTMDREPLYHELDESALDGISRSNARAETGKDAGVNEQGTVRLTVEEQNITLPSETEFSPPQLDYYEVPVKST